MENITNYDENSLELRFNIEELGTFSNIDDLCDQENYEPDYVIQIDITIDSDGVHSSACGYEDGTCGDSWVWADELDYIMDAVKYALEDASPKDREEVKNLFDFWDFDEEKVKVVEGRYAACPACGRKSDMDVCECGADLLLEAIYNQA